jgi:hypothetical protein
MALALKAGAQDKSIIDTLPAVKKDTLKGVPQIDITDVLKEVFKSKNINKAAPVNTVKEKERFFAIFPAIGYTLQTKLAVILAGNMAFYAGRDTADKVSSITSSIAYTENNQIVLPIQSNIWTKDNKYNLFGDWRISKYPQDTYGLGGTNSLDSDDHINYSYARIYETVQRRINNNFYAGFGYNLDIHWNIQEQGYATGGRNSTYVKYTSVNQFDSTRTVSSGLSLNLLYDDRESSINPTGGEYVNIVLRNNFTFMGSDHNWQSLLIDARKYFPVEHAGNVLAFWSYDWLVLKGNPPYLDLPSTSWDTYTNTGRGYIQGRFRSRQMLYLESEYRFGITRNGLLGGVVFVNAQSFSQWPGNYSFQYVQPAAGLGLRVKLNKTSKTNIDIDYGFGINNSHGLFVNIAEVF